VRTRTVSLSVVALTVVAGVLRFATLGRQSFWVDELVTVSLLHHGFDGMLDRIPASESTPYAYYVLAWPWTRIFGSGEAGLRSLSALVGTATVPVAYGAAATLVSRRAGVITAALVAVNPFLVWYSQEARSYALFAFFAALTVLFFARALHGERRSLAGWAISSSLAIATHYFAIFVVVPEALWLLARSPRRRPILLASVLPAALLMAHVPLILDQRHHGETIRESRLASRIAGIPKDLVVGYSFPAELAGSIAAAVLVAVGLVLLFRRTASVPPGAWPAGAIAAFSLVVPLMLAAFGADYVIARNMIAAIVPAAVCLAGGYAANRVGLSAMVVLCGLSLAISVSVGVDARYGRTDWRGAARHLGPANVERAIVVTPDIERELWRLYLPALRSSQTASVRVREIVVIGLATQGGFSARAVAPPDTPPRPPPPGFRLAATEQTPTLTLVRYRSRSAAASVSLAQLADLRLVPLQAAVFLQGPARAP
jgi:mannosyltransferase